MSRYVLTTEVCVTEYVKYNIMQFVSNDPLCKMLAVPYAVWTYPHMCDLAHII